jgi:hypothetical protein
MGTSDDKTTRFVVIDPPLFKLEGNIYNPRSGSQMEFGKPETNNDFRATGQAAKR